MRRFRIHGLTVVKNEADIIEQCLQSAVNWCDYIYVLDNGSDDGTWEIVKAFSRSCPSVVPFKQDDSVFGDAVRAGLFAHYRDNAKTGDWWCRLDADEIYVDNPRRFLRKIGPRYGVVWNASLQFYFTDRDLDSYNKNPALFGDDVPVQEKCRYYINNWSERRFVRHSDDMIWNSDDSWPRPLQAPYPRRIRVKHYQWRSPQQMQRRLDIRLGAVNRGSKSFRHERAANWRTRIVDRTTPRDLHEPGALHSTWRDRVVAASDLYRDEHDGRYVIREDLMPRIKGLPPPLRQRLVRKMKRLLENLS